MRLIHRKKGLPLWFVDRPGRSDIIIESNLTVGTTRLRAKFVVFPDEAALRKFWKREKISRNDLGARCPGAVNGLCYQATDYDTKGKASNARLVADARFFCIIGMVRGFFNVEIIAHEAGHAGFCYARRVQRTPWDHHAKRFDEESICYPAGIIARKITDIFWRYKEELTPKEETKKKKRCRRSPNLKRNF